MRFSRILLHIISILPYLKIERLHQSHKAHYQNIFNHPPDLTAILLANEQRLKDYSLEMNSFLKFPGVKLKKIKQFIKEYHECKYYVRYY